MSAARELYPSPTPSWMPVATAITFLSAPPSSTPTRSSCVYTRKVAPCERRLHALAAARGLRAAATTAVGSPAATSAAKLGPESATTSVPGYFLLDHVRHESERAALDPFRRHDQRGARLARSGARRRDAAQVLRRRGIHHELRARQRRGGGSSRPDPLGQRRTRQEPRVLVLMPFIASTTSASYAHSRTSCPLHASSRASAVPQAPAPTTAHRISAHSA